VGSVLNWQLPTGHWQLFLEVEETAMVLRAAAKENEGRRVGSLGDRERGEENSVLGQTNAGRIAGTDPKVGEGRQIWTTTRAPAEIN
jgi:hypothetical protein